MGDLFSNVEIQTNLCYGIFCSAKSYYVGLRCLAKMPIVSLLVAKIVGEKLPQELRDMILDELLKLEKMRIRNAWRKDRTFASNYSKFQIPSSTSISYPHPWLETQVVGMPMSFMGSDHILTGLQKPNASGVVAREVHITRPVGGHMTEVDHMAYYIHLSCQKAQPYMAMNLPSVGMGAEVTNGGAPINLRNRSGSRSTMWASCKSAPSQWFPYASDLEASDSLSLSTALAFSTPSFMATEEPVCPIVRKTIVASRLLVCDEVQESIRNWNGELIQKFVDMLDLHLVPFDEGDPLQPGLHIVQRTKMRAQIIAT